MSNRAPTAGFMLYAGLCIGVEFVATPAKFLAPHLTLPVALEVGRYTFRTFNWLEWALLVAFLLWGQVRRPALQWWSIVIGVAAIVAVETVWLLPALDARVQVIIDGGQPPPSQLHLLYIAFAAAKAALLLASPFICSTAARSYRRLPN